MNCMEYGRVYIEIAAGLVVGHIMFRLVAYHVIQRKQLRRDWLQSWRVEETMMDDGGWFSYA